jgi:hypothetical protein
MELKVAMTIPLFSDEPPMISVHPGVSLGYDQHSQAYSKPGVQLTTPDM